MSRNFDKWLETMTDTIVSYKYYTDFNKVYDNVDKVKVELNILNTLIGSKNIENDFRELIDRYPNVLNCIPILLAKREHLIVVVEDNKQLIFDFKYQNHSIDEYVIFMRETGLFDLISNHIIKDLYDYVTGVEVGLDSHGRKSRSGDLMEDLVEEFIQKAGFSKGIDYFKEMTSSEVEHRFGLDLSNISNEKKTEKRFDFVVKGSNNVYAIETNFYSGQGSKLNETARSYKTLAIESNTIEGFKFVWITDGVGWNSAKHNLEETFDVLEDLYNLKDLNDGIAKKVFI